ncbi:MAG: hypothetical protein JXA03_10925 [Bacteroidales bacterium]|nr:hypothetical protein [Bacteroidales bacterium]
MSDHKKITYLILLASAAIIAGSCSHTDKESASLETGEYRVNDGRPYTRWWWFAGRIQKKDIKNQLDWLKQKHFGGVEVAFIYPVNRDPDAERIPWLSKEWTELVSYTKKYCDSIGFGCDFTFGTLWPFGGTFVHDSDRTKIFGDSLFRQPLRLSWTHPDTGNVLDHMSKGAFDRYALVMGKALQPALEGSKSALFCDSWEVETKRIWTGDFGLRFKEKFGYHVEPYMDTIYAAGNAGPRYDYMKLVSELVLHNFFIPFHEKCHELGAFSRVQCAGSPTDIIAAYSVVDIPETEAMLYNPNYSQIVASAAALANKPVVSAETFTCLYGWPARYIRREQTADLKLVADALFANGANHIIWHGTPFNPSGVDTVFFYASVHVGTRGSLSEDLIPFNTYMEKVANEMRKGRSYTDIAVYIPQEDAWIAGEYPPEKQLPWAWGEYEMRYVTFPDELKGYHPLWINKDYLKKGIVKNNELVLDELTFNALYIDVEYMDTEALSAVYELALRGLPVCMKRIPMQAGHIHDEKFTEHLDGLKALPNVIREMSGPGIPLPLIGGKDIPEFWCRQTEEGISVFLSNPLATGITYPLQYGQSLSDSVCRRDIWVNFGGNRIPLDLIFEPFQSLMIKVDAKGMVQFQDIYYRPPLPQKINGSNS